MYRHHSLLFSTENTVCTVVAVLPGSVVVVAEVRTLNGSPEAVCDQQQIFFGRWALGAWRAVGFLPLA